MKFLVTMSRDRFYKDVPKTVELNTLEELLGVVQLVGVPIIVMHSTSKAPFEWILELYNGYRE